MAKSFLKPWLYPITDMLDILVFKTIWPTVIPGCHSHHCLTVKCSTLNIPTSTQHTLLNSEWLCPCPSCHFFNVGSSVLKGWWVILSFIFFFFYGLSFFFFQRLYRKTRKVWIKHLQYCSPFCINVFMPYISDLVPCLPCLFGCCVHPLSAFRLSI